MAGRFKSSRQVALTVLNQFDINDADAANILHKVIERTDQKAQATDIVFGVIRNRSVLDMVIAKIARRPVHGIQKKLLNILRIGAYELIFAPATAEYAIVNEAAEIARAGGKKQAGFVNAVLRNILRNISERSVSLVDADVEKTVPQSEETGCAFKIAILPKPDGAAAEYLSKAFSLPKGLVEKWLNEFGFKQTRQICFGSNRRCGIYLRPNALKVSAEQLVEKFVSEEVEVQTVPDSGMLKLASSQPVQTLPGFAEGLFMVQDTTSAKPVSVLEPKAGWVVLDMCAAPGGKTTQLAEVMNDTGKIVATDIDDERLQKVDENCGRLGIKIVRTVAYKKLAAEIAGVSFDAILLDVPCSNTGVLARRSEARYRINRESVGRLAEMQLGLLQTAAGLMDEKTMICYSTCSIMKQENSDVVKKFLVSNPSLKLEHEELTLPCTDQSGFDHDGGYVAIIKSK